MASNGTALGIVSPLPSTMSISLSSILFQSKHWIKDPNVKPIMRWAKLFPGQARLPSPNGISLYPSLFSLLIFSNLSGMKLSASFHNLESLCIAHALTNKIVPRGTSYPLMVQSLEE
ncbi:hypothetical protein F8388_026732 [Cannabis sativa]|uniref:Uncharacterized protein n=1 Tax=Cannabis sativa TaxID=3483 RepID=A0A7J6H1G4_CANSA|nr:hypothetical protein F8388_026732 [Cannabis sativa]